MAESGVPAEVAEALPRPSPEKPGSFRRTSGPTCWNAGVHVFAVLEAGDQEAEELAGNGSVDAVPDGGLRGGFGGSAEGWLTPLRFVCQPTAASGSLVPVRADGRPAAVGEEAISHRGEPVARNPARFGAGSVEGRGAMPLVSLFVATRGMLLPAKTGRGASPEAVATDTLRTVPESGVRGAIGGLEAVETRSPQTP